MQEHLSSSQITLTRMSGAMVELTDEQAERAASRVRNMSRPGEEAGVNSDCWLWLAATRRKYGLMWVEGKTWSAHRVSYELHVGPIPEGLTLDHLCRNTTCVNPAHLEPVTNAENNLRSSRHPGNGCHRGHEWSEDNTHYYRGKRVCRACRNARKRGEHALGLNKKEPCSAS